MMELPGAARAANRERGSKDFRGVFLPAALAFWRAIPSGRARAVYALSNRDAGHGYRALELASRCAPDFFARRR
jgi:hypothetical protein